MALDIIVCIKSVVRGAPGGIARRTVDNCELNPFDRPALEAALRLKNVHGGSVTTLSMGPGTAGAALFESLAMGADRAVLISDPALAESDTLVTARVLARAIRRLGTFDLLFFGVRTADSDTGQVGPQTAAVLGLPFVGGVQRISFSDAGMEIRRALDDWQETWRVSPPAAVTIHPSAFAARPIGLAGIGAAYEQPAMETWRLADLEMTAGEVGLSGSPTRVLRLRQTRRERCCEFLQGDPGQQVAALMSRLSKNGVLES